MLVLLAASLSLISSGLAAFSPIAYFFAILIGTALFAINAFAGGDIKLMLAFLPAINFNWWPVVLMLTACIGGIMAVGYLTYGLLTKRLEVVLKRGLPYGVPIAISGVFGVWLTSLPA